MEATGKIVAILPQREGDSERSGHWVSQQYVMAYFANERDTYAKHILFTVFGADKIANFNIKEGVEYKVQFDIDAKEGKKTPGQWFTDIRAWKVEPMTAQGVGTQAEENPSDLI